MTNLNWVPTEEFLVSRMQAKNPKDRN